MEYGVRNTKRDRVTPEVQLQLRVKFYLGDKLNEVIKDYLDSYEMKLKLYPTVATRPREEDSFVLLVWSKGKVQTSQEAYTRLQFPFPSRKQGREVPVPRPSNCSIIYPIYNYQTRCSRGFSTNTFCN